VLQVVERGDGFAFGGAWSSFGIGRGGWRVRFWLRVLGFLLGFGLALQAGGLQGFVPFFDQGVEFFFGLDGLGVLVGVWVRILGPGFVGGFVSFALSGAAHLSCGHAP
jgi:hypothetical protein